MGTSLVDTAVAEGVEHHDSDRVPAVGDGPDNRNCFRAYRFRSVCHTNVGCLRDNKKANHGCLHPRSCSAVVRLCRQHCLIRRGVDSTRERPAACRSKASRRISRDAFQKTTSCLRWRLESGHARTPPCCLSCAPPSDGFRSTTTRLTGLLPEPWCDGLQLGDPCLHESRLPPKRATAKSPYQDL